MNRLFFFLLLILLSCKSNTESKNKGERYFSYDEIVHYKNNFDKMKLNEVIKNKSYSEIDSLRNGVLLEYIPKAINDTSFVQKLESLGYKKTIIEKDKFEELNEIFSIKKVDVIESSCVYIYRDILIFKKKSKIVGIAKICFGCDDSQIFGAKKKDEIIRQYIDFEKIEKILK
jgi:hypothetical protein